jgi:hypothetical protein
MKSILLSVCMLAASATFASAQVCDIGEEGCDEDFRPGAIVDRESGISVFKAFQQDDPHVIILPPNPVIPNDPVTPRLPPNPILEGPGNQ